MKEEEEGALVLSGLTSSPLGLLPPNVVLMDWMLKCSGEGLARRWCICFSVTVVYNESSYLCSFTIIITALLVLPV